MGPEAPMSRPRSLRVPFGLLLLLAMALGVRGAARTALAEDVPTSPPREPAADEGPSVTVYSSADPAGFDPQRWISQARSGYGNNAAWQVPGFAVVRETREVAVPTGVGD